MPESVSEFLDGQVFDREATQAARQHDLLAPKVFRPALLVKIAVDPFSSYTREAVEADKAVHKYAYSRYLELKAAEQAEKLAAEPKVLSVFKKGKKK